MTSTPITDAIVKMASWIRTNLVSITATDVGGRGALPWRCRRRRLATGRRRRPNGGEVPRANWSGDGLWL